MGFLLLLLAALTFAPSLAEAVEYRLQVINLTEEAFAYYMNQAKGSENGSWARLEAAAEKGEVPWGAIIADRSLRKADPALERLFEAVPIKPEAVDVGARNWIEFRWQGEPGKRVVWIVEARGFSPLHEVRYVGLRGTGTAGFSIALNAPWSPVRLKAVSFPTQFILLWNGPGSLWERWISRYLDLAEGMGAVVGVDLNPTVPDRVFIVIEQTLEPKVFRAALGWRKRAAAHFPQYEAPGSDGFRIR
ncbi:MAG: hypothetical protein WAP47_00085 [Candidatus Rokuibacteriota bacterium]